MSKPFLGLLWYNLLMLRNRKALNIVMVVLSVILLISMLAFVFTSSGTPPIPTH